MGPHENTLPCPSTCHGTDNTKAFVCLKTCGMEVPPPWKGQYLYHYTGCYKYRLQTQKPYRRASSEGKQILPAHSTQMTGLQYTKQLQKATNHYSVWQAIPAKSSRHLFLTCSCPRISSCFFQVENGAIWKCKSLLEKMAWRVTYSTDGCTLSSVVNPFAPGFLRLSMWFTGHSEALLQVSI